VWHVWGREVHTGLWGNLGDIDHLEDIGLDVRIMLKWISKKYVGLDWIDLA
jgi:hypothetical protein